jgi:hypothetical protein
MYFILAIWLIVSILTIPGAIITFQYNEKILKLAERPQGLYLIASAMLWIVNIVFIILGLIFLFKT